MSDDKPEPTTVGGVASWNFRVGYRADLACTHCGNANDPLVTVFATPCGPDLLIIVCCAKCGRSIIVIEGDTK